MSRTKGFSLTANQIKTFAIIAMLIDHIAWAFVDTYSLLGQVMHMIGRTTAPIMCYFIAQGYLHTRSIKKYFVRLGIFAVISHFAYVFETTGGFIAFNTSVIYTLALGLLAIMAYDKINNKFLRWFSIIGISILAIPGDWLFFGIAFCLVFYIYRDNFIKQCIGIVTIGIVEMVLIVLTYAVNGLNIVNALTENLFQLAIVFSLPILSCYNKEKGGNRFSKWGFYIFYPLHLFIIGVIKFWIL
jgi:hypothetical protein